jgi:predicted DNA-binding transcriptional regulator AlpA
MPSQKPIAIAGSRLTGVKVRKKVCPPTKRDQPKEYADMKARRAARAAAVVHLQAKIEDPNALLTLASVRARTGLSEASIYRKIKTCDFPEPVRLGARCSRWRLGAILAWLAMAGA